MFSFFELSNVLVNQMIPFFLFVRKLIFAFSALLDKLICKVLRSLNCLVVMINDGCWIPFISLLFRMKLGEKNRIFNTL